MLYACAQVWRSSRRRRPTYSKSQHRGHTLKAHGLRAALRIRVYSRAGLRCALEAARATFCPKNTVFALPSGESPLLSSAAHKAMSGAARKAEVQVQQAKLYLYRINIQIDLHAHEARELSCLLNRHGRSMLP